jgi:hypothetical protein
MFLLRTWPSATGTPSHSVSCFAFVASRVPPPFVKKHTGYRQRPSPPTSWEPQNVASPLSMPQRHGEPAAEVHLLHGLLCCRKHLLAAYQNPVYIEHESRASHGAVRRHWDGGDAASRSWNFGSVLFASCQWGGRLHPAGHTGSSNNQPQDPGTTHAR